MIAALVEARRALAGVVMMLIGRTDFHGAFDVSSGGVARSFVAALIAIPFAAFVAGVQNALAQAAGGIAGDPFSEGGVEPYSLAFVVVRWVLVWAYFPPLAFLITTILGRRQALAPWIVLHNWTHLFVVLMQAVPLALLVTGGRVIAEPLLQLSVLIMAYAYVRAAGAALDADWRLAIPAGCANLATMLVITMALSEVL